MRGGGGSGSAGWEESARVGVMRAAPHSPQKSSPGSFEAWHCGHWGASRPPHFAQNLRPSRFSLPQFEQRIATRRLLGQLVEQRLRIFQIGQIETLDEPAINFAKDRSRVVTPIGIAQQACEAY